MSCLKDKVSIVTGSSRGLGRAIAKELGAHGSKLIVNYNQNKDAADSLVAELEADGVQVIAVQANVAEEAECKALIAAAIDKFGGIDILINNAGINVDRMIKRLTGDEWRQVIDTDLNSVFYCTQAAAPHMIERGGGSIINMASIVGQMGNLGQSNYSAAKAGIVGFSKSAAQELARNKINVVALCPGFIETEMVTNLSDEVKEALIAKIPMRRFGTPEEVARITRFLVTEGKYVTGAQININGGMYMQ